MKFALFVLFSALTVPAQQPSSRGVAPAQPSVRFSFDWAQGYPWQKYTIDVQSDGKAHFDGTPQTDGNYDTDPYQQDFTMSVASRRKIFELAQKLNYFQGDYDSHLKHVAKTGTKTLQYEAQQVKGSTSFDYSKNVDVQELLRLFSGIATTIDYGRKLAFQYRFDKLGMEQRMKELEQLQSGGQVAELEIIAPILEKIANDYNMMNIARHSAQKLLRDAGQPGAAAATPAVQ